MKRQNILLMVLLMMIIFTGIVYCANLPEQGSGAYNVKEYVSEVQDMRLYVVGAWKGNYSLNDDVIVLGEIPGLENGQAAIVTADIGVCGVEDGGMMGRHFEITNLKSVQLMTLEELADTLNVPDAANDTTNDTACYAGDNFIKYTDGNEKYYILRVKGSYIVIKNGDFWMEYRGAINPTEPLQAAISLGYSDQDRRIETQFTEDEILNLSVTELRLLLDVGYADECAFWDEETSLEEGYKYSGLAASRPAENESEACQIAEQEWPYVEDAKYREIKEAYRETDEYWLFLRPIWLSGAYSYGDDISRCECFVVYKKDYYDSKENWPDYILTEDDIRTIMRYFVTIDCWEGPCLGEYIDKEKEGVIYRRYFLMDNGVGVEEWFISSDGAVRFLDGPTNIREVLYAPFTASVFEPGPIPTSVPQDDDEVHIEYTLN